VRRKCGDSQAVADDDAAWRVWCMAVAEAAETSEDEGSEVVVRHAAWEVETLVVYNELLYGYLQPEVDLGLEVVAACESTDGSDAESEELGQYEMCMSEAEEEEQGAVSEGQGVSEDAAQGVSSGWTGGVIRHSAWEVEMLGWYNELLHGCLQQS